MYINSRGTVNARKYHMHITIVKKLSYYNVGGKVI